jgi:hypothetical protein
LNANKGMYGAEVDVWDGDIDGRVSRGHTAWLESVGLGLIRKLVCVRRETTFFDVFRELPVFERTFAECHVPRCVRGPSRRLDPIRHSRGSGVQFGRSTS